LVVVLKYGALGKFLSVFVANLIIFIYCFYTNREIFKVKFNKQIFNDALKFCYPLVIAAMLSFFSNGYDKIVLERIGNVHELGYYVVGVQIAGYLSVFSTSIDDTFQPDIFQSVVQRDFKKCTKIILSKIGLLSVIVLFFIAFAPFLVDVLTAGRYVVSTKYAMIVSLSAISSMLYHSLSQVTIALGYTKITLINKVVGSILCVAMYTMLILKWGAIGAAWGTVVSFIIFFIGNLFLVWIKNRSSLLYAKEK
jgi:O-antigen/teichoic acid export membrane protein